MVDKIEGHFLYLRKIAESSIRSKTYKVHRNACIKIEQEYVHRPKRAVTFESSDSDDANSTASELPSYGESGITSTENQESDSSLRRSTRTRQKPDWLRLPKVSL